MVQHTTTVKNDDKKRLTAFINPVLVKRVKVQGALEGLTMSGVIESALDAYAPRIESDKDQHVHLKFINGSATAILVPETAKPVKGITPKHTKHPVVP